MKKLILLFLLISTMSSYAQLCSKSDLIVKTGINEDGTSVPVGNPLNYWKITFGPPSTGLYPRKIYCITADPAWTTYANSRWVNLNSSPNLISAGNYNYQRCFCVDSADSFRIKLDIMVDDIGYFDLKEMKTGQVIKLGRAIYGYHFKRDTTILKNYPAAHDDCNIDTTLYFTKGKYCLNFLVGDGGSGVATGMDVSGSISSKSKKANAFLKDKCCSDPCSFEVTIDDSSYCENGEIKHILIANPANKRYKWNTGDLSRRIKADVSGNYSVFVFNVEDNDSCWNNILVNVIKSKGGHKISASKDTVCSNCSDESLISISPKTETRRWIKDNVDVGYGSQYHAKSEGYYCSKNKDSFGCIDTVCHRVKGKICTKSVCDTLNHSSINVIKGELKDKIELVESNPISDHVALKYYLGLSYKEYHVEVYNMLGENVFSQKIERLSEGIVKIPIDQLNSNLYFYTLWGDGSRLDSKKFEIFR